MNEPDQFGSTASKHALFSIGSSAISHSQSEDTVWHRHPSRYENVHVYYWSHTIFTFSSFEGSLAYYLNKALQPSTRTNCKKNSLTPNIILIFPECPLKVHIPPEVNSPSYAPWLKGHLTTEVILCFWLWSLCYCPETWELEPKQYYPAWETTSFLWR